MVIRYGDRGTANPAALAKSLADLRQGKGIPDKPAESPLDQVDTSNLKNNEFLGYTREGTPGYKPRPTAADGPYRHAPADALEAAQEQWDAAEKWAKQNDKLRADRIAKEAAAQTAAGKQRMDAEIAKRSEARAKLEASLKSRFMMNLAATEADWAAAKDSIIARELEDQAVAADRAARANSRRMYDGV